MKNNEIVELKPTEAKHGQKMIEIKLRFWTDCIAGERGKILPKHAHAKGMAILSTNKPHGIVRNQIAFNSFNEIPLVIEKLMKEGEIKLLTWSKVFVSPELMEDEKIKCQENG